MQSNPEPLFAIDTAEENAPTSFFRRLADWFHEVEERGRDEFLSRAANHADLERRIRVWEDRHLANPKLSPE